MARKVQYVYETESMGSRIGRFITLLVVVAGVTLTVVVSQKFSAETLALIVGILLAGVPLLAIFGLFAFFAIKALSRQRQAPPQMTIPPIIMQMPQQGQDPFALPMFQDDVRLRRQANNRSWEVMGEDE